MDHLGRSRKAQGLIEVSGNRSAQQIGLGLGEDQVEVISIKSWMETWSVTLEDDLC
jgi:hypothetical protein